ncbi:hypothetical protein OEA41_003011 [Lepraria neglecta]|uniref:U3 small nucleolar RNA-associated protein 25 n=1 Tax=Lepraria neglecta TaxID=209136 RepID=A0AAD9Z681_9LECA|nr:hypothetical protein OEA41_003011 [Lepraria neglecta]
MAPFSRGKNWAGHKSQARGGHRGAARGRGRGGGRGDHAARAGNKSTFYSTRVEERPEDASGDEEHIPASDNNEVYGEGSGSSSDSEDEDVQTGAVQPYNALLLSLNPNKQYSEPQRKKRKIDVFKAAKEPDIAEGELDPVEESEEADDPGIDLLESDAEDGDEAGGDYDPFPKHLGNAGDGQGLEQAIQAVKQNQWSTERPVKKVDWSQTLKIPAVSNPAPESSLGSYSSAKDLMLKQRFKGSAERTLPPFDKLTGSLAFSIFNYQDISFPQRTLKNKETLRKLTCLHVINHIFKTRDTVIKNNARLGREDAQEDIEYRDQGFTRPKVLVILPTRHSCVEYVHTIISLCEPEQQENKKRFQETYASGEDPSENKPEDFRELFAGNDDDMFRLGLKFTRKTVKFFTQFYNSDIIFASPLGLRMALGADDPRKQDNDFLSSIEVVVFDQTEAMLMQNWEHVEYIFEHLNLQPKEAHGCDFSRVRNWYLDGNAKHLRQTILLSAFNFPSLNRLYTHHMVNVEGKIKYSREEGGAMIDLGLSLKQTFSRFDFGTPLNEPDNRFKYFATAVVPSLTKHSKSGAASNQGVLIYLPTYADFVRVRNYLASSSETQDISFGSISEYTSARDVARARSHFLSGRHSVLLYTERAHHFRRYRLKGVKRVIMYGLPENPIFYKEVVGEYLGASIASAKLDARTASVRAMFSRLDILKLERVVGTARYLPMLKENRGDTFDFV